MHSFVLQAGSQASRQTRWSRFGCSGAENLTPEGGPDRLEMNRRRACCPPPFTSPSAARLSVVHTEMNPCLLRVMNRYIRDMQSLDGCGLIQRLVSVCVHGFNGSI